jgi:hypothetical protein
LRRGRPQEIVRVPDLGFEANQASKEPDSDAVVDVLVFAIERLRAPG